MDTGGGGGRGERKNVRDFLRVKQEDYQNNLLRSPSGRNNFSDMTLNTVLRDQRGQNRPAGEPLDRVQSNRTLLDIIREESGNGAYRDGKQRWRHFKDKIHLHRNNSGSAWTSSVPIPASDVPISNNNNRTMTNQSDFRPSLERNSSRAMRRLQRERDDDEEEGEVEKEKDEEEEGGSGGGEDVEEQQPVRTSLMALLAETDGYTMEDDDEEEEEVAVESGGGGGYNNCCICMVRHKGAAFIPCGHTFCRLCSRELYAQRGNCPLCNNYILEILDIF